MITIVRVEDHHDPINQMLAAAPGHDTIVIFRAPRSSSIADQATPASAYVPFSGTPSEEEITWEDAEWQ